MTMTEHTTRPQATQETFGRTRMNLNPVLGQSLVFTLNGREVVADQFTDLETPQEQKGYFDEWLGKQRQYFPQRWVEIYEVISLIKVAEWYWQDLGFDSFDAFWAENGEPVFGAWAEMEQTHHYAKLAAPHLFDVSWDKARQMAAIGNELSRIQPAKKNGQRGPAQKGVPPGTAFLDEAKAKALQTAVPELCSPEKQEGIKIGKNLQSRGSNSNHTRFKRLRRDAPEVAAKVMAGDEAYFLTDKHGQVKLNLKPAEVEAGIVKPDEKVGRQGKSDPVANIKRLSKTLTMEQLKEVADYIQKTIASTEVQ